MPVLDSLGKTYGSLSRANGIGIWTHRNRRRFEGTSRRLWSTKRRRLRIHTITDALRLVISSSILDENSRLSLTFNEQNPRLIAERRATRAPNCRAAETVMATQSARAISLRFDTETTW